MLELICVHVQLNQNVYPPQITKMSKLVYIYFYNWMSCFDVFISIYLFFLCIEFDRYRNIDDENRDDKFFRVNRTLSLVDNIYSTLLFIPQNLCLRSKLQYRFDETSK